VFERVAFARVVCVRLAFERLVHDGHGHAVLRAARNRCSDGMPVAVGRCGVARLT
jgi:hypothetical protein